MFRLSPVCARYLFAVLLSLGLSTATARHTAAQCPMPPFTGQRVSISGPDTAKWQPLERFIRDVEKQSPQTYFVVVVQTSGKGSQATVAYTDRLQAEWILQATKQGVTFDSQRTVLILLDLENRQLAACPGSGLLAWPLGLENSKISNARHIDHVCE